MHGLYFPICYFIVCLHFSLEAVLSFPLYSESIFRKVYLSLWFRLEVKDKTDEVHLLNDTLASEQKKSRELQWALEKEKAKLGRDEERDKEELEVLFSLSLNICGKSKTIEKWEAGDFSPSKVSTLNSLWAAMSCLLCIEYYCNVI